MSTLLSLWQAQHIFPLENATMVAAAQSGKCAANIDGICVSQVSPCQAMTSMAGSSGCPPKATVFASTNVPYQVGGIAVVPLNDFKYLPGL